MSLLLIILGRLSFVTSVEELYPYIWPFVQNWRCYFLKTVHFFYFSVSKNFDYFRKTKILYIVPLLKVFIWNIQTNQRKYNIKELIGQNIYFYCFSNYGCRLAYDLYPNDRQMENAKSDSNFENIFFLPFSRNFKQRHVGTENFRLGETNR